MQNQIIQILNGSVHLISTLQKKCTIVNISSFITSENILHLNKINHILDDFKCFKLPSFTCIPECTGMLSLKLVDERRQIIRLLNVFSHMTGVCFWGASVTSWDRGFWLKQTLVTLCLLFFSPEIRGRFDQRGLISLWWTCGESPALNEGHLKVMKECKYN